jgi:hypothetical protein
MPHLNKRGRIYRLFLILYSQLRESYFDYAFYRYHVKVWCSVAFFHAKEFLGGYVFQGHWTTAKPTFHSSQIGLSTYSFRLSIF